MKISLLKLAVYLPAMAWLVWSLCLAVLDIRSWTRPRRRLNSRTRRGKV